MDGEHNGLTLERLAQRLEALERENAELRSKVATLGVSGTGRDEVATLRGSDKHWDEEPTPKPEGRVSRRQMLSRAGAAAAGLVLAGALTQRDIREAKATPTVFSTNTASRGAVEGSNVSSSGYGVWGNSAGVGVRGTGNTIGVRGKGFDGVVGESSELSGFSVLGVNTGGG